MTTWGSVVSRFDFSKSKYSEITQSTASNQGSAGVQSCKEILKNNKTTLLTSTS